MTQAALNNLWNYLQGLQLSHSNRQWLSERLIEPTYSDLPLEDATACIAEDETAYITSSPAMVEILEEGRKDIAEGKYEVIDLDEIWK